MPESIPTVPFSLEYQPSSNWERETQINSVRKAGLESWIGFDFLFLILFVNLKEFLSEIISFQLFDPFNNRIKKYEFGKNKWGIYQLFWDIIWNRQSFTSSLGHPLTVTIMTCDVSECWLYTSLCRHQLRRCHVISRYTISGICFVVVVVVFWRGCLVGFVCVYICFCFVLFVTFVFCPFYMDIIN